MFDTFFIWVGGLRTIINDPVAVVVELLLIGLSVNWVAGVLHGTRGTRPLRSGLMVLVIATLVVNVLAARFDWPRLPLLYHYFVIGLAFIALIAFQPEVRRAVIRAGDVRFLRRGTPQSRVITALVQSARYLSKNRFGGLIAIQRAVDLSGWAENGTMLHAHVSTNLLNTVFFPNSPLHDLGVIVAGSRVLAANCQFPVAESEEVGTAVGSRHLAAVGMSYESDALVLVVSEETGTISLADNGKLTRFLSIDDLADELTERLSGQAAKTGSKREGELPLPSRAWRVIRRGLVVIPLTAVIWILANQAIQTEIKGVDVRIDVRLTDPNRAVEIEQPKRQVFKVTFSGTARAVETLRAETRDRPLRVDWLADRYRLRQEERRPAQELLDGLSAIQSRGLAVVEVFPDDLVFSVDELVTVTMGVRATTGNAQVEDLRFEPDRVQVTLRQGHLQQISAGLSQVVLPLEALLQEERLRGTEAGRTITLSQVRIPEQIGGFPAVKLDPKAVDVSLRIVGQRITQPLSRIIVRLRISMDLLERYDVQRVDEQEWLVGIDVEGDENRVSRLRPEDVRAFVTIPPEQLTSTEVFRRPVEFEVPEGIRVLSERSVQLRVQRRE